MAAESRQRWAPTRTSTPQSASLSLHAVLGATGWLLDLLSPRPHRGGCPCPFPANTSALRRPLPGRTPWVGVWRGPPPARPWPRGPVQVRAGPALGAVPRRSRPGGGGTQWDQFSDWVSAGGATPPRWLWGHSGRVGTGWGGRCVPPLPYPTLRTGLQARLEGVLGPSGGESCLSFTLLGARGMQGVGAPCPGVPPAAPPDPGGCSVRVGPAVLGCPVVLLLQGGAEVGVPPAGGAGAAAPSSP